jgi:hypothetical protein
MRSALLLALVCVFAAASPQTQKGAHKGTPKVRAGHLQVGQPATEFRVKALNGQAFTLSSNFRRQPTVLVFGSYTCPPFRTHAPSLQLLFERYGDRADIRLVYIQEAHPSDGNVNEINVRHKIAIKQHATEQDRLAAAAECVNELRLTLPVVIDAMNNSLTQEYAAWPVRIYVIASNGNVFYKSKPGVGGFKIAEAEEVLRNLLGG